MNPTIITQKADYENTKRILKEKHLRLLTYQEALVWLDKDTKAKEQLKGKWFWLDWEGSILSGYYTFNDKGELTEGKGNIEETVYAWSGSQPLSLDVLTDLDARIDERRYYFYASGGPSNVASVVVGKAFSSKEKPLGKRTNRKLSDVVFQTRSERAEDKLQRIRKILDE